jgi:LytTr DNA-binding domain
MTIKSILLFSFFSLVIQFSLIAANELPPGVASITERSVGMPLQRTGNIQTEAPTELSAKKICFSTRSGFLLLRKKDLLSISIHKLYGGLLLQFWNREKIKSMHCQGTLSGSLKKLNAFPFFQVNRSTIVNLNEVSEYVGTRRDAHLVLRDGSTVKVSMIGLKVGEWLCKFPFCTDSFLYLPLYKRKR